MWLLGPYGIKSKLYHSSHTWYGIAISPFLSSLTFRLSLLLAHPMCYFQSCIHALSCSVTSTHLCMLFPFPFSSNSYFILQLSVRDTTSGKPFLYMVDKTLPSPMPLSPHLSTVTHCVIISLANCPLTPVSMGEKSMTSSL